MQSQKELIEKGDWDVILVLDACRYDYFEEFHQDYLPEGDLFKVRSEGSSTGEWLYKTFPGKYDMTYISTNPYVNGYGIPISKCNPDYEYDWNGRDHFSRIIDAWDKRWNDELETVLPQDLNDIFLNSNIENQTIVHYMQPHLPYLNLGNFGSFDTMRKRAGDEEEEKDDFKETIDKIMVIFEDRFEEIFGKQELWKIKKILKLRARSGYERTWRAAGGEEGLREYYKDNLQIVLKKAAELVENIDGKVVITSDHGEAFGEKDLWFHKLETHESILTEVPWYEINKDKH